MVAYLDAPGVGIGVGVLVRTGIMARGRRCVGVSEPDAAS